MENRIYDEKNGLWYEKQGDYFIPCLSIPEEEQKPIGIWGQRHLRYIKQHKRVFYTNLLTSCKLNSYLADVDEQAEDMFSRLVKQLAEKENVTEKLKAENQMLWVQRMNSIRNRATEIVHESLIYPDSSAIHTQLHTEHKEPPKIFWKYYDLYRRKRISLSEYASATGLSAFAIRHYLKNVVEKRSKVIENPKQI